MGDSNILTIVDYTAFVAAGIDGVKAVAGAGTNEIEDPLRPGHKISAAEENPAADFTHFSEVPNSPGIQWVSQNGTVELTWYVPMRLWLPKTIREARRMVMPFYNGYLRAFVVDRLLDGKALRTEVKKLSIGGNKNWSWLDVTLMVVERVNYGE